jgi:tripartite ATP-independent transporter DctM subunit
VADTSAIGSVMIPQMEKTGYPRVFATNVTISASVQALLVPPSHNAVIYSLATGGTISIISLFMAGVAPGLLLGASLIVLCLVLAYRNGHPRGEAVPWREALKIAVEALWGLVTLAIILGGILGGVFTAIEAGAVACLWAFFVTMFVYRDYRWRDLPVLVHRTMRTVAMVMTLIAFAASVGYVMALMQVPARVTALLLTLSSDKNVILLLINILLLVLGCLLDMAPSILICTPILLPVMVKFGVDPVHFGMIMLLNLGIGLCHPPVGSILFVGCAVGRVTIEKVVREIWPFYAVMFFRADAGNALRRCRPVSARSTLWSSVLGALPATRPGRTAPAEGRRSRLLRPGAGSVRRTEIRFADRGGVALTRLRQKRVPKDAGSVARPLVGTCP